MICSLEQRKKRATVTCILKHIYACKIKTSTTREKRHKGKILQLVKIIRFFSCRLLQMCTGSVTP